jgi:hypothetical protein
VKLIIRYGFAVEDNKYESFSMRLPFHLTSNGVNSKVLEIKTLREGLGFEVKL